MFAVVKNAMLTGIGAMATMGYLCFGNDISEAVGTMKESVVTSTETWDWPSTVIKEPPTETEEAIGVVTEETSIVDTPTDLKSKWKQVDETVETVAMKEMAAKARADNSTWQADQLGGVLKESHSGQDVLLAGRPLDRHRVVYEQKKHEFIAASGNLQVDRLGKERLELLAVKAKIEDQIEIANAEDATTRLLDSPADVESLLAEHQEQSRALAARARAATPPQSALMPIVSPSPAPSVHEVPTPACSQPVRTSTGWISVACGATVPHYHSER